VEAWELPRIREEVTKDLTVALGTESFPYRTEDRLRLEVDPATFAAIDGRTELVVYFAVPIVSEERMRYRKGLVLYDDHWNEVARATEEMNYTLAGEEIGSGDAAFVLDLFRVWLAPGTYHAAIQIDEWDSGGLGVWVETIEVEEPAVAGVGLSDIVLAADISTAGPARFMRYGHVVYAFPSRAVAREQPLHFYYEIYGLGVDRTGATAFRVDYTVRADHIDRSALGRVFGALKGVVGMHDEPDGLTFSFERFGPPAEGGVWPEYLSVDPDELRPGQYTLEVEIIDHLNGDRKTHRAETFTIVK
jgi:hypothetical protein